MKAVTQKRETTIFVPDFIKSWGVGFWNYGFPLSSQTNLYHAEGFKGSADEGPPLFRTRTLHTKSFVGKEVCTFVSPVVQLPTLPEGGNYPGGGGTFFLTSSSQQDCGP